MAVFFWQHDLEPEFPLSIIEYETCGDQDQMHWHDYFEVALCLEGPGRFLFGRREYTVEPGDLFLIDNLEAHVAVSEPGVRLRFLLTLFLPELIAAPGCRGFDSAYLEPFLDGTAFSRRVAADSSLAHSLRPILFELKADWDRHDPGDRFLLDANLRRFLGLTMKYGRRESDDSTAGADRQLQVRPALAWIKQHFRDNITLEQVAEVVHVSPSRARHLFKDATSIGFKEYVTTLRLAEAKRLLLQTNMTVSDVASNVGYTNIHQFYKVFSRYGGMTPADYRRYYTRPGDGVFAGDITGHGASRTGGLPRLVDDGARIADRPAPSVCATACPLRRPEAADTAEPALALVG